MVEPDRFFFLHLQKTGGTALYQRLRESFGPDAVYPTPEDQGDVAAVIDVDHLRRRFAEHQPRIRVITGHFPFCIGELLGVPLTTFTILRDPVERTLSVLRRRQAIDAAYQGRGLVEIYESDALRPFVQNHMTKMLSFTPDELSATPLTMPVDIREQHLERAKVNLQSIAVVGLQERFEEACEALQNQFGWDLGPPRFANRSVPQPIPDGLRERIAADNSIDQELYAYAEDLVALRTPAPSDQGG